MSITILRLSVMSKQKLLAVTQLACIHYTSWRGNSFYQQKKACQMNNSSALNKTPKITAKQWRNFRDKVKRKTGWRAIYVRGAFLLLERHYLQPHTQLINFN